MNNVPSSAILVIIAVIAAVLVGVFAFSTYQASNGSAGSANNKANNTMNQAAEMRIMQYDDNEYRGSRVREIITGLASDQVSVIVRNNTMDSTTNDAMAFGYSVMINGAEQGNAADGTFVLGEQHDPTYELGTYRGQNDMADSSRMKEWVHDDSMYKASVIRSSTNDSIVAVVFDESGSYHSSAHKGSEAGSNTNGAKKLAQSYAFELLGTGSVVDSTGNEVGQISITSNDARAKGFTPTSYGYAKTGALNDGENITITLPTASANGSAFQYWVVSGPGLSAAHMNPGETITVDYNTLSANSGVGSGRYTAQAVLKQQNCTIKYAESISGGSETGVTSAYANKYGFKTIVQGAPGTVTITNPSASEKGANYHFVGWTYHSDFGSSVTTPQTGVLTVSVQPGTITFVANFVPVHTITYTGMDGATNNNPTSYYEGETVKLRAPSKSGETFTGWYNGSTKITEIPSTAKTDYTITATWAQKAYSAKFEANGGTFRDTQQTTMAFSYDSSKNGAVVTDTPIVTKKGYKDPVWKNTDTNVILVPGTTVINKDTTFVAQWNDEAEYDVTVHLKDANGTDITKSLKNIKYSTDIHTTLNNLVADRYGYEHTGWSTGANGTGTKYGEDQTISKLADEDGVTVNLYATYEAKWYTITYHANDGTNNTKTQSFQYGTAFSLNPVNWTRTRYKFAGWAKTANATTAAYADGQTFSSESDMKGLTSGGTKADLYAVWTAQGTTITFNSHGGTFTARTSGTESEKTAPFDVVYTAAETTYGSKIPTVTRAGYKFAGWWTTSNDDGYQITDKTSLPKTNTTIHAHWELEGPYTITLHMNGGMLDGNAAEIITKTYTVETPSFSLDVPVKDKYDFAGWTDSKSTDSTFNGTSNKYDDMNVDNIAEELGLKASVSIPRGSTGNKEYYAEWYTTIEFDTNGGSSYKPATINKLPGQTVRVPSEIPIRSGYTFIGWSENKKASYPDYISDDNPVLTEVDSDHKYTDVKTTINSRTSMTLYAVWIKSTETFNQDSVYVVPVDGYYKLDVYGAQGANGGGKGGYTSGTYFLKKGTTLYLKVGTEGKFVVLDNTTTVTPDSIGGIHGGGNSYDSTLSNGGVELPSSAGTTYSHLSGGGYSSVSLTDGELDKIGKSNSSKILSVAGGGGASYNGAIGGDGGAETGQDGESVGTYDKTEPMEPIK